MKILVTGGTGYIGSVTIRKLLEAGHEVSVFDNVERGHRESMAPGVPLVVGDLRDAEAIRTAVRDIRPDAVMHFAAYALVGESMRQPELYFRNNVVGGCNLLDAMREYGVTLTKLDDVKDADCVIVAVAHNEFRALSLNDIKALFRKDSVDNEKVLIDVKGLYKIADLNASGMKWWRL